MTGAPKTRKFNWLRALWTFELSENYYIHVSYRSAPTSEMCRQDVVIPDRQEPTYRV